MSKLDLGTITDTKSHKQSDGTTLIELLNEEQVVMIAIRVVDQNIGHMSIRKDGRLVNIGVVPITEFLSYIAAARAGECNLPALKISPLH